MPKNKFGVGCGSSADVRRSYFFDAMPLMGGYPFLTLLTIQATASSASTPVAPVVTFP